METVTESHTRTDIFNWNSQLVKRMIQRWYQAYSRPNMKPLLVGVLSTQTKTYFHFPINALLEQTCHTFSQPITKCQAISGLYTFWFFILYSIKLPTVHPILLFSEPLQMEIAFFMKCWIKVCLDYLNCHL